MRKRSDRTGLPRTSLTRTAAASRISLNGDSCQRHVIPKQTLQFLQGLFPVDIFDVNVIDATLKPEEIRPRSSRGQGVFYDTPPNKRKPEPKKKGVPHGRNSKRNHPVLQQIDCSPSVNLTSASITSNSNRRRASSNLQRALDLSSESRDGRSKLLMKARYSQRCFMINGSVGSILDEDSLSEIDCGISPTNNSLTPTHGDMPLLEQARMFAQSLSLSQQGLRQSVKLDVRRSTKELPNKENISSNLPQLQGSSPRKRAFRVVRKLD